MILTLCACGDWDISLYMSSLLIYNSSYNELKKKNISIDTIQEASMLQENPVPSHLLLVFKRSVN